MPGDAEDRFAAALAHHEAGRLAEAAAHYRALLADHPAHAESLHLLGLILAQGGDAAGGAALIRRAMALAPGSAPHHHSLALALAASGEREAAVLEYRAAAALRPGTAEIHNNLATLLLGMGRRLEAIAEYRVAASHGPGIAEIWCNLAGALGAEPEAEACFRRAIALRKDDPRGIGNYGRWLTEQGRWAEAELWLRDAVRLAPGDAASWCNLGVAQQESGRASEATASFRHAIAIDPGFAPALYNLGCALSGEGHADEAVACHEAAFAADPGHGAARLAACMARLPILYRTEAEIAERRAAYLKALDALVLAAEAPEVARALVAAVGASQPFFLPYQGQNDRAAQAVYGGLVCRLLEGGTAKPRPRRSARIRVGIVSGFFQDHTIFRLFLDGWLTQLDRARFEVVGFHTGRGRDTETARAEASCDRFVRGLASPEAWETAVADSGADVLLYPEVGMDPIAGRLAARRLAPVQCVAWGQPETTGLPTMDFFLGADLMEPPDAEAHYTETLVRLPNLGMYYTPDPVTRPEFAMREADGPVYWSGQALYKYLPQYDSVFPRIAAAVGQCRFVFIGFARSASVTDAFQERLRIAFAAFGLDAGRYCTMLPPMDQAGFLRAAGAADVMLDTLGWSGGRSTLDCLTVDPAIVTWPGPLMRGRHTAAILRRIGCEETIAASVDDYVTIAVRLGRDPARRADIRRRVAECKHAAFRDVTPVRALETLLATWARPARQFVPGGG